MSIFGKILWRELALLPDDETCQAVTAALRQEKIPYRAREILARYR